MKVKDVISFLSKYNQDNDVYLVVPVPGDEGIRYHKLLGLDIIDRDEKTIIDFEVE